MIWGSLINDPHDTMVRKYKRKQPAKYTPAQLASAVEEVKACLASRKKFSWDGIAKAWGVPPATLRLNVVGRTGAGDVPQQPRPGAAALLPPWVEAKLAAWVSESCEINLVHTRSTHWCKPWCPAIALN